MTANGGPRRRRLTQQIAWVLCPRDERSWLDALFAELDAPEVDSRWRAGWMLGTLNILTSVIRLRAGLVPAYVWWGMVIAFHAAVVFAIGSRTDFEGLGLDDDVFLRFAWFSGVLLIGLGVLAINRIFSLTDALPRNRH